MRPIARALKAAGHQAIAPTDLRSDGIEGDSRRQTALERKAAARARRLVVAYRDLPAVARPEAWLTCDLRHTAPDLIGPAVAEALGIPYLLAGASYARAEAGGADARWLSYTARAIARARAVLSLTAEDEESIRSLVPSTARLYRLAPFLDLAPYRSLDRVVVARRVLEDELPLDPARPWLLAVAPMQTGAALASWRLLGALAQPDCGPAVAARSSSVRERRDGWWRRRWRRSGPTWRSSPARGRRMPCRRSMWLAISMSGPPIRRPSPWQCWRRRRRASRWWRRTGPALPRWSSQGGETGLLTPRHDDVAFAGAVVELSTNAEKRQALGAAALARVQERHGIEGAAATLRRALDAALADA